MKIHSLSLQICKKLSGEGRGTADWCSNVQNEDGQILACVLTCDESRERMAPMANGLMDRCGCYFLCFVIICLHSL